MRLVFIYRRLVVSSTHFGKRDNFKKLFDSIVTVKTLVGRKYYPSRRVLRKREAQYGHIQFLPKLS